MSRAPSRNDQSAAVASGLKWIVLCGASSIGALMPEGYKARPEQAFILTVSAWDSNCPQHIPQRFAAADATAALEERDRRIEKLTRPLRNRDSARGEIPNSQNHP